MPRLPTVGGDEGNWGNVLNTYLQENHTEDGKLKIDTWADSSARPASPKSGQTGINLDTGQIEIYDGSNWVERSKPRVVTGTSSTPPSASNYEDGTIYFKTS